MTTLELKDILIHKIAAINDKSFLNAISTIIDAKTDILIYQTTGEQRNSIKEGQDQIGKGQYLPNDQVEAEVGKWLKER